MRVTATPLGERIRLMAAQRKVAGQEDRAEGLIDAANLLDEESSLLTGKPLAELIGRIIRDELREQLPEFVADVVSALRSDPPEASTERVRPSRARVPAPVTSDERPPSRQAARALRPAAITSGLPKGEHQCLVVLVQHGPGPVPRDMVTALTGFKKSTRDAYLYRLQQRGYATSTGGGVQATPTGITAAGDFERLPVGKALREWWLKRLPDGEALILDFVLSFYPHPVTRERITDETKYAKATRDAYIYRLMAKRLLVKSGVGSVEASPHLFTKTGK